MMTLRLAVCLLATLLAAGPIAAAPPESTTVATVNGTAISQLELEAEQRQIAQQAGPNRAPADKAQPQAALREQALENLISRELLFQASRQNGIEVPESDIQVRIDTLRKRFPSEDNFQKALAELNLTEDQIRRSVRKALAIRQLIETQVIAQMVIPEEDSQGFYEQYRDRFQVPEQVKASHILITVKPDADDATRQAAAQRIAEIEAKIAAGEPFDQLARTYSEGPSATKGGDLGFFRRGQMVPAFDQAAFALEPGQVSEPVSTRFGLHLIKVTDRKAAGVMPYEEARAGIEDHLKKRETSRRIDQLVETLRAKATIEAREVASADPTQPKSQ